MFFSKFPLLQVAQDGRFFVITDAIRRVVVGEQYAAFRSFLMPYTIQDGERPEHVSQRFYGSPHYHWVLLLLNNITNPRAEWPMRSNDITPLVFEKYDFILTSEDVSYDTLFTAGDEVITSAGVELVVTSIFDGELRLRSQNGKAYIENTDTLNNATTEVEDIPITAIDDPESTVHHYEDENGVYIEDTVNGTPVTNFEYESTLNDNKRNILVLGSDYLNDFVRLFFTQLNA